MLVIRRRPGESIVIGDGIEVQVEEIGPTRVKLCITAPKEVAVMRKEVRLTRDSNLAAACAMTCLARVAGHFYEKSSQAGIERADTRNES
ncbi:MAG: carbon storage regulator [Acidobacteriota bacterium]